MGASKPDEVWETYYAPHLGAGFKNNPSRNLQRVNERVYIRVLTELAANRFKWVGLPDSIDQRYLELTLFSKGLSVFFWEDDFERYFALAGSGAGPLNQYNNPTSFVVYGNSTAGLNKTIKGADCVPIWANYLRAPDLDIVYLYARRLAKFDRTIELTVDNLRHTKVVKADENTRQSWQNIMRQVDEGIPVIYGTAALDLDSMDSIDLGTDPEVLEKLMIGRTRLWGECMTMLGINNMVNNDKKERVIESEVASNEDQINGMRAIALNARRQAAAQINAKYGLTVSVNFVSDLAPAVPVLSAGSL